MSIRAIIFDMGGVIVRTEDIAPRTALASRLGISYDELSQIVFDKESARLATVGKISTEQHWEAVRLNLGLTEEEFPTVPLEFWGGDELDTSLVDYLRSKRPVYKTALLSNAWDDLRGVLEDGYQIADAFDVMVISAEVGVKKPDPRIYQIVLERLDVTPEEAVFVDDFIENVEAARQQGMYAIHFQDPGEARSALEKLLNEYS
jgi:epoxide hydrolase-like predicted phosphatase